MKTISGFILTNVLGWDIIGEFLDIKKSIIIFAPHTVYGDAVYGKRALHEIGLKHTLFIEKKFFFFPMNMVMRWWRYSRLRRKREKCCLSGRPDA